MSDNRVLENSFGKCAAITDKFSLTVRMFSSFGSMVGSCVVPFVFTISVISAARAWFFLKNIPTLPSSYCLTAVTVPAPLGKLNPAFAGGV